jgi:hypothetical protein
MFRIGRHTGVVKVSKELSFLFNKEGKEGFFGLSDASRIITNDDDEFRKRRAA